MKSMSCKHDKNYIKVNILYVGTVSGIFKKWGIAHLSSMALKYQVEGSYFIQLIFSLWFYYLALQMMEYERKDESSKHAIILETYWDLLFSTVSKIQFDSKALQTMTTVFQLMKLSLPIIRKYAV